MIKKIGLVITEIGACDQGDGRRVATRDRRSDRPPPERRMDGHRATVHAANPGDPAQKWSLGRTTRMRVVACNWVWDVPEVTIDDLPLVT